MLIKKNHIKTDIISLGIIIASILIGYYQVFLGYNFWTYIDNLVNSSWAYGNSLGNGWRPDKGFGISFFYSDPGSWHSWSLRTFWMKFFSSREIVYNTFVIAHSIFVAVAIFYLLKKIIPEASSIVLSLLCPLIIFAPGMDGVYFESRTSVSVGVIPLMLILLYEYYKNPKLLHYFLISLIFWYNLFFGYFLTWTVLPSIGLTFTILYSIYYNESFYRLFFRYILFFLIGSIAALILGAWETYSIFHEGYFNDYVRGKDWFSDNNFNFKEINFLPNLNQIFLYFNNFFNFYTIPTDITLLGVGWRPFYSDWNIVPFFPIIFIYFLFRTSNSFWEFSMKWLLLIYYGSQLLLNIFPAIVQIKLFIQNYFISKIGFAGMPIFNWYVESWYCFVAPMQVGLIAIFVNDLISGKNLVKNLAYKIGRNLIAFLFLIFFSLCFLFCFLSLLFPNFIPDLFSNLIYQLAPDMYGEYPNYFLGYVAWFNLKVLEGSVHWYSLIFYLAACLFFLLFLNYDKFLFYFRNHYYIFLVTLLFSMILFSWHVYPLNNNPLIWKEVQKDLPEFKHYDRFLYVGNYETIHGLKSQKIHLDKNKFNLFKKEVELTGGPKNFASSYRRVFKGGMHESPGLRLHGHLGFYQKDVYEFISSIFPGETQYQSILRHKYLVGQGPIISSKILDFSGVTYYYSEKEIENLPQNLSLIYEKTVDPLSPISLYIYKNNAAKPYFYLAKDVKVKSENNIKNPEMESAYVNKDDFFILPKSKDNSFIKLEKFQYGKLIFNYNSDEQSFLVVSDAWHPNWKAELNGENLKIIKTNQIFKGIKLPKGQGRLTLYFDTSPYKPGIYITLIAWFFVIIFFLVLIKKKML